MPPPSRSSNDVRIEMPSDTYGLARIAVEAAERLQQNQVNRTIRAGKMAAPLPSVNVRPVPTPVPNFILNMPIR